MFERLLSLQFVKQREKLINTGPRGIEKSFLALAMLGQYAVKNLFKIGYFNTGKLHEVIKPSKIQGNYINRPKKRHYPEKCVNTKI